MMAAMNTTARYIYIGIVCVCNRDMLFVVYI